MGTVIPSVIIMDRIVYGGIVRMVRLVCFWSGNVFCLWSYGKFRFVVDFLLIPSDFLLIYIPAGMTKWKSLNERRKWGALSKLNGFPWGDVTFCDLFWIFVNFGFVFHFGLLKNVGNSLKRVEAFKLLQRSLRIFKVLLFFPPSRT